MKKVLFIMMLGLMFGQTNVTSKFYTIEISGEDYQWVEINSITGYNQSWYIIEIIDENVGCRISMDGGTHNTSDNHRNSGNADFMIANSYDTSTEPIYLIDSNPKLRIINFYDNCIGEVYANITSNFPEEDTGYIEEGFEYCINEGNNLVSYPCDNAIPIAEAIPSSETFLDAIIGEGVAASYLEGVGWIGSLSNLQSGDGYWFQANTNVCFQYECSD